jgi:hypothetical protein
MFRHNPFRTIFPATLFVAAISAAGALGSPRGTQVAPVNNVVFEVGARGAGSGDDLWCGASDYARRTLKAGWKAKIYVVRGRGGAVVTSRTTAAHFTLDPAAAGIKPLAEGSTMNTLAVGYNMSVQRANGLCLNVTESMSSAIGPNSTWPVACDVPHQFLATQCV